MIPNLGIPDCVILVRWSLPSLTSMCTENNAARIGCLKPDTVSLDTSSMFDLHTHELCTGSKLGITGHASACWSQPGLHRGQQKFTS